MRASLAGVGSLLGMLLALVTGALVFPRTIVHTRVVHVVDPRPRIRPGASVADVEANFAGKPYHANLPYGQMACSDWMQNESRKTQALGAWVMRVCYQGPTS